LANFFILIAPTSSVFTLRSDLNKFVICSAAENPEAIATCKEMPVILVNKVANKKIVLGKGGRGEGKALGVAEASF
jgi:hypothetical protein